MRRKNETRSKNVGTMQKSPPGCNVVRRAARAAYRGVFSCVRGDTRARRRDGFTRLQPRGGTAMRRMMRVIVGGLTALTVVLGASAQASAFCIFNCTYTKTKYPIVLEHGLAGFDELFGVYSYWF